MPAAPRRAASPWLLSLFAAVVIGIAAGAHGADWEQISDKGGLLVQRRPVAGSSSFEIRVTTRSPLSPAVIFDTLWSHRDYPQFIPHLKRLEILSDTGNDRVVYEQVAVPLAQDRDYTVRLQKHIDPAARRYEIFFEAANDAGPAPDSRHVRVQQLRGSWTIEPDAGGKGSLVRYDLFTEPGGSIPTWIANRAQRESVADLVAAVLKRARENEGTAIKRAADHDEGK
ncbi:MAG TPA: START domain-containing protein [Candidatus Methylomirabilis sp.]|nr:START domain-containing protein [Candidatus Methylomirabilis sp.]